MCFVIFASYLFNTSLESEGTLNNCLSVCVSYFGITFYAAPSMSYYNQRLAGFLMFFNVMDKFSF